MADLQLTRDDPERQLRDQMKELHAVMLGLRLGGFQMQPMAPFLDDADRSIWFFTRRDTDLFKQLGDGQDTGMIVVGKDHDYHASLEGILLECPDPAKRELHWNPVVSAWFDGIDDPFLALLEFRPSAASIWASTSSSLVFGWEIVKGNIASSRPEIGEQAHIRFHEVNG